jgi:hypothetical protein
MIISLFMEQTPLCGILIDRCRRVAQSGGGKHRDRERQPEIDDHGCNRVE